MQFAESFENSVYTCQNSIRSRPLRRARLGFGHFSYHKFKHSFLNTIDPLWNSNTANQETVRYFLDCPNFSTAWNSSLNEIAVVDSSLLTKLKSKLFKLSFMVIQPILSMIFFSVNSWYEYIEYFGNFLGKRVMVNA